MFPFTRTHIEVPERFYGCRTEGCAQIMTFPADMLYLCEYEPGRHAFFCSECIAEMPMIDDNTRV